MELCPNNLYRRFDIGKCKNCNYGGLKVEKGTTFSCDYLDDKRHLLCHTCPLNVDDIYRVDFEGSFKAEIMLLGEAPGQKENILRRPFIGPTHPILLKAWKYAGFVRSDFIIWNMVNCRPPGNKTPLKSWQDRCSFNLRWLVAEVNPVIIGVLGSSPWSWISKQKDFQRFELFKMNHPMAVGRHVIGQDKFNKQFMKLKKRYWAIKNKVMEEMDKEETKQAMEQATLEDSFKGR